jgi:hypothetical protein
MQASVPSERHGICVGVIHEDLDSHELDLQSHANKQQNVVTCLYES